MAEKGTGKQGKIRVTQDGPYIVTGGIPLAEEPMAVDAEGYCHGYRQGKTYPAQESYALCRCGGSGNKPYCDGTHLMNSFDGTETATREPYLSRAETTAGPSLKLTDAKDLCAAARFCHRAGGVWELTRQSDVPRARRTAIEEAGDCPSGRLVVWDEQGRPIEPDFPPSIGLIEDEQKGAMGPIWAKGGIPVEAADGQTYEVRHRVTLCRCGRSANKPFCDGSHLRK